MILALVHAASAELGAGGLAVEEIEPALVDSVWARSAIGPRAESTAHVTYSGSN